MASDVSGSPREQLLFLVRAESRVRILLALVDVAPMTQRSLRSRLDVARTTVSRALQALEDRGWVERVDGAYRLTRTGEIVAREFDRTLETMGRVDELAEFLRWVPASVDLPDLLDANDVDVTYASDAAPYAPARKQSEILTEADRLRILLPATDLDSTELIVEEVVDRGLDLETVISPDVEAVLESDGFAGPIRRMLASGATLYVAGSALPFYLGIADDETVQIGLSDGEGLPRALLETDDPNVRSWAQDLYQEHRESAVEKPPSDL